MDQVLEKRLKWIVYSFIALFLGAFLIGSFFPSSFLWGVNHLAFVGVSVRVLVLGFAVLLAIPKISFRLLGFLEGFIIFLTGKRQRLILASIIFAGVGSSLFYYFRIATNMYGDSPTVLNWFVENVYSFSDLFKGGDYEPLTRMIHQQVSIVFGIDTKSAYEIVSALCGGIFLWIYLRFTLRANVTPVLKSFMLIAGITCGANQLFFGHVEDYTIIYLWLVIFLILGWHLFDGKKTLSGMVVMFLIGIRLHIIMILILPALLFSILYYYRKKFANFEKLIRPKNLLVAILTSLALCLILYLFYFKAYSLETLDPKEQIAKIFLPVINLQNLPHEYLLLSIKHISDVLQLFIYILSPAIILVIVIAFANWKIFNLKDARLIFSGLAAFYFVVFDTTVNSTLSIPRDWDLLSVATAPLLFLSIQLVKPLFENIGLPIQRMINGFALAAGLCSCTIFGINANQEAVGHRLEGIGQWVFKSYYWGSAYIINVGVKSIPDPRKQFTALEQTVNDLQPYQSDHDQELGVLYGTLAMKSSAQEDFNKMEFYCTKALQIDSMDRFAAKGIMLSRLSRSDYNGTKEMLDYYNEHINEPSVADVSGLVATELVNNICYLASVGADSALIKEKIAYASRFLNLEGFFK